MNEYIKNSVNARKDAIFNAYEIKDKSLLEKIDNFFKKLNSFASEYDDVMKFEEAFASSNLNKEYIDLFTEISTNSSPKQLDSTTNDIKSDEEYIMDDIESEIRYQTDDLARPIRREVKQQAYDKVRDIPVVGDALNVKQHFDLFNKFKKKNDSK